MEANGYGMPQTLPDGTRYHVNGKIFNSILKKYELTGKRNIRQSGTLWRKMKTKEGVKTPRIL
jgi:hypothetical protein